ncbi:unknown [Clostridium sp. CAG:411]|nr:cyclic lactone autoinducer peptide [Lachnospiraceae bacterium]CDE46400.1 unknown [Clostridium sp. CAG:411]
MSKKLVLKVIEKIARTRIEEYGWPPRCSGFLHQPVRPKRNKKA